MAATHPLARLALGLVAGLACAVTLADWQPDPDDKRQARAAAAIDKFRESRPGIEVYFDEAHGFAVLPSVTRAGLGFGAAYGNGLVIEQDTLVGTTGYWQVTSGIQAGAKNFIMLVFFKDAEALAAFKARKLQFMGQAGVALATASADSTPTYNEGVAVFTLTNVGLMGELTVSGAKFTYKDLE